MNLTINYEYYFLKNKEFVHLLILNLVQNGAPWCDINVAPLFSVFELDADSFGRIVLIFD